MQQNHNQYENARFQQEPQYDESNISPNLEEIEEYAKFLGMDPVEDQEFLYIAKQGLLEPLPYPWEMIKGENDIMIYVNTQTQEEQDQHPLDDKYRQWFQTEKQRKIAMIQYHQMQQQHIVNQQQQHQQQMLYTPLQQSLNQSPYIPSSMIHQQQLPQQMFGVSSFPNQIYQDPNQQQNINMLMMDENDSAIVFDERQIINQYNQHDFETFNPTQDTRAMQNLAYQQQLLNSSMPPNLQLMSQGNPQWQQANILASQNFNNLRDISVNTSFQTEINNFVNTINQQYLQELKKQKEQYLHNKINLLKEFQDQKLQQRQQQSRDKQKHIQNEMNKLREESIITIQQKLQEHQDLLRAQMQRKIVQDEDHSVNEVMALQRQKINRKYEQNIRYERDQLETLHNLEIQRFKLQYQQKLSLQKQKIQLQYEEDNQNGAVPSDNYYSQVRELEEMRLRLDEEVDDLRDRKKLEINDEITFMRKQYDAMREREQQRIEKHYQILFKEEDLVQQQFYDDLFAKKEAFKLELKDKNEKKIELEMKKLHLEFKDQANQIKIRSDRQYNQNLLQIKNNYELSSQQSKNSMQIQHYRDSHINSSDKYKIQKENELKLKKEEIDKEVNGLIRDLNKQNTIEFNEMSQNQKILKELESLKKELKDKRQKKINLEHDIEHEQLMRQKISTKFELLKVQIGMNEKLKGSENEKHHKQVLQEKEQELKNILNDIERIKEFKVMASGQKGDRDTLYQEIKDIKEFIRAQPVSKVSDEINPQLEISELRTVIPREINKVEEQISQLKEEKETMNELLKIVGNDLMTGIDSEIDVTDRKKYKAWGIVTDFRVNIENQKPKIQNDIYKIEKQIDQLEGSLNLLLKLKQRVETAQSMLKVKDKQEQLNDDVRQFRREMESYIRQIWAIKQSKAQNDSLDIIPTRDYGIVGERNRIAREIMLDHGNYQSYRAKKYAGSKSKASDILSQHNYWMQKNFRPLSIKI
ncbi:ww domain containing protein [Stylonychia lemnae]|uniref:Ww domain containing protein n=1 Tax=Stylonychia lemnae TaxID=5949 RepID=A0A078BBY0_STYLE|nr:ww domain containing protein [Stylonychia lemnae]|eukprot:CDW91103.1 ww domain containing protein [Stylonychia lemnae]